MANYLTNISTEKGRMTCNYRIPIAEFGKLWELVSQTGIREGRRDKAAAISKYVADKYLNKETPFQGSNLEIRHTLGGNLVVAVTNLGEDVVGKYVSSKQIPNERELYDDRLMKIVVKGIRECCSDNVFEAFAEI
ncbi:MAG: hypothetical protein HYY22_11365 [Thaumarchaeota archaeon]|nr:hypothetical protein [Nitrososphaerota archaeon]